MFVTGGTARTRVEPSGPFGLLAGRAARVELAGQGGRVSDGPSVRTADRTPLPARVRRASFEYDRVTVMNLPVQRLRIALSDVTLDAVPLLTSADAVLVSVGQGEASMAIAAEALEMYARTRLPELKDLRVALDSSGLCIQAVSAFPPGSLVARAEVEARDGREVAIVHPRLWLNGEQMPDALAEGLLATLNPVLTTAELPMWASRFTLRDARTSEGVLRLVMTPRFQP